MGPQEMLDRADIDNKWKLTPMKDYQSPHMTERIFRTPAAVLITSVIYQYLLHGRNPCFALIGAVYGIGSRFEESFHNGFNRFVGTLVGGGLVIPFHWLYTNRVLGLPEWVWLVIGLCLVLWGNMALGADSAIQPGTVVYFVVMFTVGDARVVTYTIARVLDTGVGVFIALCLMMFFPSKYDREKGINVKNSWKEMIYSFKMYKYNNRKSRQKEQENYGMKTVDQAGEKPKDPFSHTDI